MTFGYNNIFPLENSEAYRCSLCRYEIGHSGLYFELSLKSESPFYLLFPDARYFSGPPSWQGADFRLVEKPDKHLRILETLEWFNGWPKKFLLERMQVYIVQASNADIKIVAADVERLDEFPRK